MKGAVVYISSNRENGDFENKIISDLISKNNLPIYSVTHKKIFEKNTKVVGDVGTSGFNFCRQ